jgi:hypothetical protein
MYESVGSDHIIPFEKMYDITMTAYTPETQYVKRYKARLREIKDKIQSLKLEKYHVIALDKLDLLAC